MKFVTDSISHNRRTKKRNTTTSGDQGRERMGGREDHEQEKNMGKG